MLPGLHHGLGPLSLGKARADGDLEHLVLVLLGRIHVPDEVAVDLELAQIVVRRHVAAATPALVADPHHADLVRVGMTVGGALLLERRGSRGGHVLQPFGRFLRSPASDVDRDVGLAADLLDEIHEFVGAEGIGVDHAAPCGVERGRPLLGWADSFAPVVLVGKAAARPADVGHLQRPKGGHNVLADSARVRNRGIRANPDALVKAMPEILRELAEEVAVDLRSGLGCVDGEMSTLSRREMMRAELRI